MFDFYRKLKMRKYIKEVATTCEGYLEEGYPNCKKKFLYINRVEEGIEFVFEIMVDHKLIFKKVLINRNEGTAQYTVEEEVK